MASTIEATGLHGNGPPGTSAGLSRLAIAAILVFGVMLVVPLAALVIAAGLELTWPTLAHLAGTILVETAVTSALLALGTVLGAVVIGVGAAWCVERYVFPLRNVLAWLLILPLAMPTYVIAWAYTDLLQFSGPVQLWLRREWGYTGRFADIRTLWGAIVLFSFVLYPYVYLMARNAIAGLSLATIESARALGHGRLAVFSHVVRPLIGPGVVAGAMLVLMETLADIGATFYFGLTTFSAMIYKTWFAIGDRGAALVLAVALLLVVSLVYVIDRRARGRARLTTSRTHRPWPPERLDRRGGWLVTVVLALPVLIGFVIPVIALLWLLLREPEMTPTLYRFGDWTWNSIRAGLIAATATVAFALALAWVVRFAEGGTRLVARQTAGALKFGYAVPGTVIALAILWPVAAADRVIGELLGLSTLLVTGTITGVIYACMLRFFAVAWGGIDAGMAAITPNLDAAARSLGSPRLAVFWRVHVPLLQRPVLVAWLLVLIDVMKELPATLMLRPFGFDTLAVITQQLSADERLAEAALPSLAIVAIGTVPVIVVSRLLRREAGPGR